MKHLASKTCGCLCCALWDAIREWHVKHGDCAAYGGPVYGVVNIIEATALVQGELLAHSERVDKARAGELMKLALERLSEGLAHHRELIALGEGERHVH